MYTLDYIDYSILLAPTLTFGAVGFYSGYKLQKSFKRNIYWASSWDKVLDFSKATLTGIGLSIMPAMIGLMLGGSWMVARIEGKPPFKRKIDKMEINYIDSILNLKKDSLNNSYRFKLDSLRNDYQMELDSLEGQLN